MSTILNFKSKKFWLILFFLIYSVFGWFAVPYIVKQQAINSLKDIAAWDTQIESVVFNPYALSLAVHGFQAKDEFQQDSVSFDRFYVNFSALGSLGGRIAFDEVSLTRPSINAQLDEQGLLNFQRDFVKADSEAAPEEVDNSEPLAFFFGLISISHGLVNFTDRSSDETFMLKLEPLNLALKDFSTDHNDGGNYSLNLSLGQGQELSWKGQIGIAPFSSKGSLALSNLRSSSFWHYVKPFSPYSLNNALISLEGSYDTEFSDQRSHLLIETGSVSLSQIALAETQDTESLFTLDSVSLSPINFNLEERTAKLGNLLIEKPVLFAKKDETSQINLLRPLQQEKLATDTNESEASEPIAKTSNDTSHSTQEAPFKWSVTSIKLKEGLINWQDASLETPADISLENIYLELGKVSYELDKAFSYNASFNTGGAKQSLSGQLAALPLNVEGDLSLSALPLHWSQPYIGEQLNVLLEQGQLDLSSNYQLSMTDSGLSGEITSNTSVNNLDIKESIERQEVAGFKTFALKGVKLKLAGEQQAPSISVETVQISKPYARAKISEKGEMSLAQLSKSKPSETEEGNTVTEDHSQEEHKSETAGEQDQASQPANIAINRIIIEEGRFDYIDASLTPVFNTYVEQFSGDITNISSDIDAHSKVALSGNLDTYGKIAINGTTNPLSAQPNTALDIQVNNIDLSTASPYSAKYAGYLIDKGKLDLDLAYDIKGSKLKADNKVFIDQFNFGKSVDSPDATVLPLPLAIGIMKNLDGEIDIDLPISGDLSDPSFSFGGVLLTAFTNLITKVVTSPFSILGSLVEGSDDISSVNFSAMSSSIDALESEKILKLAEALKKRPNLSLEVRGVADRSVDLEPGGQVLGEDKLAVLAKSRALAIASSLVEIGGIPEQRIFTLEPKVVTSEASKESPSAEQAPTVASIFTIKPN